MVSDRCSSSSSGTEMISDTSATSGLRSEEIVCADSEADVIVTATGESDSEEIVIGV
jgi:hypothetical protein